MKMLGKVAIVTGAGYPSGIGRAIALALAREGADVVVADVNGEGAEAIAGEARALGRRALAVRTDVSDEEQVSALAEAALREFGRVDVLANAAGVFRTTPLLELSAREWDWMMAVNLKGAFLCTKAVLPAMIRQGGGRIVSIASMNAEKGAGPGRGAHYAASKAGIIGFAKSVALQMAPYGITSNVVSPGAVETDLSRDFESPERRAARRPAQRSQIPLGRLGTPEDVAEAVLFLASDSASYITGEVLDVNGGWHID